jgi:NAD(P)H-quinone oxidoreductase subunit 5
MQHAAAIILCLPVMLLLGTGLIRDQWSNQRVQTMRQWSLGLLGFACLVAALGSLILLKTGPVDRALISISWPLDLNFGVYFDGLSAVMLMLISFVGLVIARYSGRYLDGEAEQGRFFRWLMFTLGAVMLFVISRNLLMLAAAWMLTSFGLHRLLTHYPERKWAIWAARKKFLISRFGDAALIGALILTYLQFESFDYEVLFAASGTYTQAGATVPGAVYLIGALLVISAMTKSAQFPFHSWLPDTMETPTPVSALMHAGVINAGGFLIIRLSPLIEPAWFALDLLAIVGALTAIVGGVVMLTQTSVKRSLAYSTVAQMGFMMLQCGLGAYSAALLHLVAHSLYKAYAFLSSGSVLDQPAATRQIQENRLSPMYSLSLLAASVVAMLAAIGLITLLTGIELWAKPGGLALSLILAIALTQMIWHAMRSGMLTVAIRGVVLACGVAALYVAGWWGIDVILQQTASGKAAVTTTFDLIVMSVVAAGFIGLFTLQALANNLARYPWMQKLYVHTVNGFYLDIPARRLTARVWGSRVPTP